MEKPGRGSDQFNLRFPEGMRERIRDAAEASGRSMNQEIVDRLQASLDGQFIDLSHEGIAAILKRVEASAATLEMMVQYFAPGYKEYLRQKADAMEVEREQANSEFTPAALALLWNVPTKRVLELIEQGEVIATGKGKRLRISLKAIEDFERREGHLLKGQDLDASNDD